MFEEYKKTMNIPKEHTLKQVSMKWNGAKRGQDSDDYVFDEIDQNGHVVARYHLTSSTSTYPPFKTTYSYSKITDIS